MSRKYESWERANKSYFKVFGVLPRTPYNEDDSETLCEAIVEINLCRVFDYDTKFHPLKRVARNRKSLIDWFNHKYPKKHE